MAMKCPGQDTRYWSSEAAYEISCPACGTVVELFKDESRGRCPTCGFRFRNPKINLGCAEWCPNAEACLGPLARTGGGSEGSLTDKLLELLHDQYADDVDRRDLALAALVQAQALLLEQEADPRLTMLAAALAALAESPPPPETLQELGPSLLEISTATAIAEGNAPPDRAAEADLVRDSLALARYDLALRGLGARELSPPPLPPPPMDPPDGLTSRTAEKLAREIGRRHQVLA